MNISFGDATLVVSFEDGDDEFLGSSSWAVKRKLWADMYEACAWEYDDETPAYDAEEDDPDEMIWSSNADSMADFLRAARCEGGRIEMEYMGNPYWFFHDLDHAEYDSYNGIDESAERRALPGGARRAHEHGIGLGLIFRELAKAEPEFVERFSGGESDAIETFADYLEQSLTTVAV